MGVSSGIVVHFQISGGREMARQAESDQAIGRPHRICQVSYDRVQTHRCACGAFVQIVYCARNHFQEGNRDRMQIITFGFPKGFWVCQIGVLPAKDDNIAFL